MCRNVREAKELFLPLLIDGVCLHLECSIETLRR